MWVATNHARARLAAGKPSAMHRIHIPGGDLKGEKMPRLPAQIKCPICRLNQLLDPDALMVEAPSLTTDWPEISPGVNSAVRWTIRED